MTFTVLQRLQGYACRLLQARTMCILFMYNGAYDEHSDYSLILISNRDEYYDRKTQKLTIWKKDPVIVGGRDLEVSDGGTWLAVSPTYKKLGVLLNIPGVKNEKAASRGKIVADYVGNKDAVQTYVESIKSYTKECNEFVFIAIDFGSQTPAVSSYNNVTDQLQCHNETCMGFGNSLPEQPLKKVEAGQCILADICKKYYKEGKEKELTENLIAMLKSNERYLPDEQLKRRQPNMYEYLSSIYVCIPERRYGTRTHTIVLLTKNGRLNVTEFTQPMPIDPTNPQWEKTEFQFNL